ncbi:MAG: helix-turn-helix domain-containing protein [Steroidobacteraceae bacterium]
MNPAVGKPRGILQQAPGAGIFHHARVAPSPELAGLVQHFWIVRWDLRGCESRVVETLPHPNVHLAIEPGQTHIHGIQTGRFTRTLEGHSGVFGVKFRPGGFRPFLQRSVSTLRNASLPVCDVFGAAGASLEDDVFAHQADEHMIAVVERFLVARLPPVDPNVERIAKIVDDIAADRSITAVEQSMDRWGMRMRPLQRLFNEYVGIGPKWVINRYRLHEAIERLAEQAPLNWAELALELGYFDQAHFIRDFKAMVGRSPVAYMRDAQGRS